MSRPEHDRRVDFVEFAATDIEATKKFYIDAFGWSFEDYGPDYVSFTDGRLAGGFYRAPQVGKGGGALVVIYSTHLEGALERVRQSGGVLTKEIFSFPGGRRFHFADPNGNELAVWTDLPPRG
jgi:predicted enzyme related to lactoylglutathione lyase